MQPLPVGKKQKNRFTVLLCCNADGSENFELIFISTTQRSGAFKKKYGYKYGLDYHSNSKAWMTSNLFFDWLQRFDAYISWIPYLKFVLLIFNCSAHRLLETLSPLPRTMVIYLPPNTASKIQPCDAVIIAAMKANYRLFEIERSINLAVKKAKALTLWIFLSAMKAFNKCEETDMAVIQNCWRHNQILEAPQAPFTALTLHLHVEHIQIVGYISDLFPVRSRTAFKELLNPFDEEHCIQYFGDDIYWAIPYERQAEPGGEDDIMEMPTLKEQLHAIGVFWCLAASGIRLYHRWWHVCDKSTSASRGNEPRTIPNSLSDNSWKLLQINEMCTWEYLIISQMC